MMQYDPISIYRLAKSFGYYEMELSSAQQSRGCRFRHNTREGGVTLDVYFKSGTSQVTHDTPVNGRYPALLRRNQTWQDLVKIIEFPSAKGNIPPSRLADGSKMWRSGSKPVVEFSMGGEEAKFLTSKEAPIDESFDSISFGVNTYFILYSDGSFAHSKHIPSKLYNRLLGRAPDNVRPEMVKLGKRSLGSFFIQYADGCYEWAELSEELDTLLEKNTSGVDVLALGEEDCFYVKFKDGEVRWTVSYSLDSLLQERAGVVVGVALGGAGAWCVQYSDGRVCSEVVEREFTEGFNKFNMVEFVELGLAGDWLVTGLVAGRRRNMKVKERLGSKRAGLRCLDRKSKVSWKKSRPSRKSKHPPAPLHAVPGGPGCICLRYLKLVLCKDCGSTFRGRVRQMCGQHPNSIYLLDMVSCKDCDQNQLEELDLPLDMVKGERNKLMSK